MNSNDQNLNYKPMYTPWPVESEQKIHAQGSIFPVPPTRVPVSTQYSIPIRYGRYQSNPIHLPIMNHPQASRWITGGQLVTPHEQFSMPNDNYYCKFLAQLVGSYRVDEPDGGQLEIVLAAQGDQQYAIVRRLSPSGEDRLIYEENSRFTLCVLNGDVEAIMLKGVSSMQWLTWYRNDGKPTFWRRTTSNPAVVGKPTSRRKSKEFLREVLGKSTVARRSEVPSGEGLCSRPEVLQPNDTVSVKEEINTPIVYSSNTKKNGPSSSFNSPGTQNLSDEDLFNLLQEHCRDHVILQKVLHWGISRAPNRNVANKRIEELCNGRFWVSAWLSGRAMEDDHKWQGVIDDLRGAYQEVSPGLYLQPAPKVNEPGIQHRLRSSSGYWLIEKYDVEQNV